MAATVVTFGNFKGGTGKTTNATMVGYELSNKGKKVLLIPQANATNLYLKTRANLSNITPIGKTLMTAIKEHDLKPAVEEIKENLYLIPSSVDFSLFPRHLEKEFPESYEDRVKSLPTLVEPLKEDYDFILLDIPPTISLITDTALYMSDYCVIVMQTQERSLKGAQTFIAYMQEEIIEKLGATQLQVLGILPVILKKSSLVDKVMLQEATNIFGDSNMFGVVIPMLERLKRYDITGITNVDIHDGKIENLYSLVADHFLLRVEFFNDLRNKEANNNE